MWWYFGFPNDKEMGDLVMESRIINILQFLGSHVVLLIAPLLRNIAGRLFWKWLLKRV